MNALLALGEGTYRWLDERLNITGVWKATALHPVPRNINWAYNFGAAVLTAFMFQVVTGIFLAFTYVPTPDHAYQSLSYITHHEFFGNFVRGLHLYGASAMVMLIFIHMTLHFLTGSYKYPRELHWLTGAVLLILTIVMAFTGQLLRWNQDAYWAIVVGAEQAARTPVIGGWVAQLLSAGDYVNGTTLTRFYAIHIWLAPGGLITFITVHLYLVIYKGVSEWPEPGNPVDPKTYWANYQRIIHEDGEPFFPNGVFKDTVVILIVGAVILFLTFVVGTDWLGPLGDQANPAIPAAPRPDWYLIWYFGILALVPAASANYVIIFFPAVAFGILFIIPIFNKGERSYKRRPWAVAIVGFAAISTFLLIWVGYREPWKPVLLFNAARTNVFVPVLPKSNYANLSPLAQRGAVLMHKEACLSCHMIGNVGGVRGPDLSNIGAELDQGQLVWRIARGGGGMPEFGQVLKSSQIDELVAYLLTRNNNEQIAEQGASSNVTPKHPLKGGTEVQGKKHHS